MKGFSIGRDYTKDAFRAAIRVNPNFLQAHLRLAALLQKYLNKPERAREHRCLARQMKTVTVLAVRSPETERGGSHCPEPIPPELELDSPKCKMPPLEESLVVVTGLPRSGTSMLMQMLAAGGLPIVSDAKRAADEDNSRGYLEFEPVKNLMRDSSWLSEVRGKTVKIVALLLAAYRRDFHVV